MVAVAMSGAVALTACSSGGGDASDRLVVGSYGGDTDVFLKQFVDPLVRDATPDTEILYSSGDTATLKSKLVAEANSASGTFDAVMLSDKDLAAMKEADVLMELDPDKISNWENIDESLVDDYCVPHFHSAIGITYNPEMVDQDVTSWNDFFDIADAGQAGQWDRWSDYVFYGAAAAAAGGDPGTDLAPGYDTALEAAPKMKAYGTSTQIKSGLIAGEIAALVNTRANAAQWSAEAGSEFVSVVPEEGTREYIAYACIPANSQNPDAAYEYLNGVLDPSAQVGFAENMYYAPAVTNAELDPELQEAITLSDDESERIYTPDIPELTANLAEESRMWDEAARS